MGRQRNFTNLHTYFARAPVKSMLRGGIKGHRCAMCPSARRARVCPARASCGDKWDLPRASVCVYAQGPWGLLYDRSRGALTRISALITAICNPLTSARRAIGFTSGVRPLLLWAAHMHARKVIARRAAPLMARKIDDRRRLFFLGAQLGALFSLPRVQLGIGALI